MTNGKNMALAGLLYVQQPDSDNREELGAWQYAIDSLDVALSDLGAARSAIDQEQQLLDRIEASHVLGIEGGNAESRKARLTLELADDERYQSHHAALKAARERLSDADRRVAISKERCRLMRATLALRERVAA